MASVATEHILHTPQYEDDQYHIAKECSHGWSSAPARVVSSLAMRRSVVHYVDLHDLPRVTVHSVGRLGRGCTLTRSCIRIYLTPQQVRAALRSVAVRNHSLHPRPLDSEISSTRSIAWLVVWYNTTADPIHSSAAFV